MTLWIITLLFIFIESFPVLTKASQKRDSYEKMLVTLAMEEQPRQLSHYLAQQEARLEAEIDHTPFVVPNQYRAYLIALGVACCAAFPFIYNWVNQLDYPLTPTVIFYMFSPLAIILAFISAEMIALRSRTLWQSLKPAEDLNFNLQALSVLLIPLAIFLYVLLNPNPELLDKSVQLIDTSPVLEHTSFWAGWGVCYLLLLVLVMKNKSVNDPMDESARQKQISEIEKRQRYARQAYRKGSFSLYGLTVFCALCGFLLYTKLPIDAPRATYWQLQGLLTSIPICAVIFHAMGVRVPITTLLSIANSKLKRVYTVSVIFFSITAAGMCMLLLVNHLARPIYTSQQAQSGSPPALSTSAAQVPLASSKPAG